MQSCPTCQIGFHGVVGVRAVTGFQEECAVCVEKVDILDNLDFSGSSGWASSDIVADWDHIAGVSPSKPTNLRCKA